MNVRDLMNLLSTLDPDMTVVVDGYENGLDDQVAVRPCTMLRDANDAADWWLGRHEQADPGTGEPVVWIRGLRRCKTLGDQA